MNFKRCGALLQKLIFLALLFGTAFYLFAAPQAAYTGILKGFSLCYYNVIPALFPFFILTELVLNSFAAPLFGIALIPYTRLLRIHSKAAATTLLLGFLGGFAVGAKAVSRLYTQGQINRREAELLLCVTINSGPAFIVNTVGYWLFKSSFIGFLLLISLLAASLCTGVFMRLFLNTAASPAVPAQSETPFASMVFVNAINSAVHSIFTVCGFVICFCFAVSPVGAVGLSPFIQYFASAFLEVTTACNAAHVLPFGWYFAAAALSVCGYSVFLQIRAMLHTDLHILPLLLSRLFHLPCTILIFALLLRIFPSVVPVGAISTDTLILTHRLPPDAFLVAFLFCTVFLCELFPQKLFAKK